MQTVKPTAEMLAEWKRIFEAYHAAMKPNRKTGTEVDQYFWRVRLAKKWARMRRLKI